MILNIIVEGVKVQYSEKRKRMVELNRTIVGLVIEISINMKTWNRVGYQNHRINDCFIRTI